MQMTRVEDFSQRCSTLSSFSSLTGKACSKSRNQQKIHCPITYHFSRRQTIGHWSFLSTFWEKVAQGAEAKKAGAVKSLSVGKQYKNEKPLTIIPSASLCLSFLVHVNSLFIGHSQSWLGVSYLVILGCLCDKLWGLGYKRKIRQRSLGLYSEFFRHFLQVFWGIFKN